ncbi:YajD family HNH nuclease [Candidatus Accumulibacter sp. ACC003]|uniref:YajD family HNH nuclease n=1 Tax=Candidatus Accumulibacter sp. ACC003 TaxID=2823334 RepID=UPI0025BB7AD5|nr:YajD family HNH nuclease [Candidatus Accumulibacter sp. ACC003]
MAQDNARSAHTDRLIADAVRQRQTRESGYREQALKIYPWICGRCTREFTHLNLRELTVHHRDHNHDNNPGDGSNWELLCLYCHDNEHSRQLDAEAARQAGISQGGPATVADRAKNTTQQTMPRQVAHNAAHKKTQHTKR